MVEWIAKCSCIYNNFALSDQDTYTLADHSILLLSPPKRRLLLISFATNKINLCSGEIDLGGGEYIFPASNNILRLSVIIYICNHFRSRVLCQCITIIRLFLSCLIRCGRHSVSKVPKSRPYTDQPTTVSETTNEESQTYPATVISSIPIHIHQIQ
jgi:hypothetical protein